ncbi:ArsR/SmtB family transcription factor [Blastomonas sp.]|uniref:ArsR/SmtB family transcription factor n=1 Tax=Blastomonas sp. TaxID=1909299 RepID=UPI00359359AD
MPQRVHVARELAELLKLLAHPDRIRLIEELRLGECDVNTLARRLNLPPSRLSQHLGLLRAARLVEERRHGRQHMYYLVQPQIARWIADALAFVEVRAPAALAGEAREVRELWS